MFFYAEVLPSTVIQSDLSGAGDSLVNVCSVNHFGFLTGMQNVH